MASHVSGILLSAGSREDPRAGRPRPRALGRSTCPSGSCWEAKLAITSNAIRQASRIRDRSGRQRPHASRRDSGRFVREERDLDPTGPYRHRQAPSTTPSECVRRSEQASVTRATGQSTTTPGLTSRTLCGCRLCWNPCDRSSARTWCGRKPEVYRTLRPLVRVPIAVGEHFGDRWDANVLIEDRLIDYSRVSIPNCGGINGILETGGALRDSLRRTDPALHRTRVRRQRWFTAAPRSPARRSWR